MPQITSGESNCSRNKRKVGEYDNVCINSDIERVLFTHEELFNYVGKIGARITEDYKGKNPIFIGVLKGCFVFMADLMRTVKLDCQIDFISVSSYGDRASSSGDVQITKDLNCDVAGRDIVIVEDILDSGITLSYIVGYLKLRNPSSVKVAALFDKPSRRRTQIEADYCGCEVPDEFIVGYGLDYAEMYRNLPYIGILKPEVYRDAD